MTTLIVLQSDTVHGSATFVDDAGQVTFTAVNNVIHSTAQAKIGASSIYVDGGADRVSATLSAAIGTGDFVFEAWWQPSAVGGLDALFGVADDTSALANGFGLLQNTSGKATYYAGGNYRITGTTTLVVGTWYHLCICRSSGVTKLFVNGVQEGSNYTDTLNFTSTKWALGYISTYYAQGYFDRIIFSKRASELRTENFTPPTTPVSFYTVSGTITDASNLPCQRTIRAYDRATGNFLKSTTSDPSTGAYSLGLIDNTEVQIIALDDAAGTVYNDKILRVTPS